MRHVILECPETGSIAHNISYSNQALIDSLHRDEAPIAIHLLYTQKDLPLDAGNEKTLSILVINSWLEGADALVIYADLGITKRMEDAIRIATKAGTPIEFRYLGTSP
jgi:hypothetical protein